MSYPQMGYKPTVARPMSVPPRSPAAGSLAPRPATATGASPYATQVSRYREAEMASAPPGQLVVMLFEKMVLTLRRAQVACEAKRIEERCELLLKVMDMLTELRSSLDHEQGGDISAQLDALYGFMLRELVEANRHQDAVRIAAVARMADDLREAFASAQQQLAAAAPVPAARSA